MAAKRIEFEPSQEDKIEFLALDDQQLMHLAHRLFSRGTATGSTKVVYVKGAQPLKVPSDGRGLVRVVEFLKQCREAARKAAVKVGQGNVQQVQFA